MSVATAVGAAIAGYLIGSLPTAECLGKLVAIDIRRQGSMNPGATTLSDSPDHVWPPPC